MNFDPQMAALGSMLFWICPILLLAGLALTAFFARSLSPKPLWIFYVLIGILIPLFCWKVFPPTLRVQWDENVLYSTSLAMSYQHTAYQPIMALPGENGLTPVRFSLDRRPTLFSFLASLLNGIRGPAPNNLLLLNAILLGLFSLFLSASQRDSLPLVIAAPLLLTASPLLLWVSSSGSLNLLAVILLCGFLASVTRCWRDPSIQKLLPVIAFGLACSYSRYEMFALFLIFFGLCALRSWKHLSRGQKAAISLSPLALLPVLTLLIFRASEFEESQGGAVFSLGYLLKNLGPWLSAFFGLNLYSPYPVLLHWLGLLSFGFAFWRRPALRETLGFWGGAALFQLVVALAFFSGHPLESVSARLYLGPSVFLCLAPLLLVKVFPPAKTAWGLFAVAMLSTGFTFHTWAAKELLPEFPATPLSAELESVWEKSAFPDRALFVSNLSFFFVSRGKAAVSPDFYLQYQKVISAARADGKIQEIYWVRTKEDDPHGISQSTNEEMAKSGWEPFLRKSIPISVAIDRLQ